MKPPSDVLTVRAFRAINEPATCAEYIREHRKVLEDFGVMQVVGGDDAWVSDPDCVVLIAEHRVLGMVGGIRIERASVERKLRMERSIASMDPTIGEVLAPFIEEGCGEICGLWNANRFAGKGLPLLLSEAAVSLSHQVDLRRLTCFVAHYTLRHALKVGFQILEQVGDGGSFNYPLAGIKSFAMMIPDTLLLETAPTAFRERIISLRCRPVQERQEAPTGTSYAVRYLLHLDPQHADMPIYGRIATERWRQTA